MQALIDIFGNKNLIPHGYCLSWSPLLLWLHVISDLLITLAYFSIPIILIYFIRKRQDFPYPWLVSMFAGFIIACGTTHLFAAITIWIPLYWLDGFVKAGTALISITTAVLMIKIAPRALTLPTTAQLQAEIQHRKAAEEALRESNAFITSTLDSLTSQIAVLDQQGVIVQVNNTWAQFGKKNGVPTDKQIMLGFNYLEACKTNIDPYCCNHTDTAHAGILAVLNGEKNAFSLEYPCTTPNKQYWFRMHVSPLRGLKRGAVISHEDITVRKQADKILIQLKAMIDISFDGFWIVDMQGNLLQANDAYAKISGYSIPELLNMNVSELEINEDKVHVKAHIAKVVSQGFDRFETRHRHKYGHALDIEISAVYLSEFQEFCVFCHDISQRKQREQQDKAHLAELAHATRLGLMGQMASGIAHEVNQPLAAITSYTEVSLHLIDRENPNLAKLAEILAKTQQQALRAGQIIHRMRDFIKADTNRYATVNINSLIDNTIDLCSAEIKQNSILLSLELANDLPPVTGEAIQLEQVLINLIRNSIEALQNIPENQPRNLSIHTRLTPDDKIQVRVKDNGPGMDKDQQLKIFTPFFTTKPEGMGMGLSISRSLIQAHGGVLYFKTRPGKGTAFYCLLPIEKSSDQQAL